MSERLKKRLKLTEVDMSEQEKLPYNLVKNFIHAVKLDQHDWEDWPEDSREAFEKMLKWANSN